MPLTYVLDTMCLIAYIFGASQGFKLISGGFVAPILMKDLIHLARTHEVFRDIEVAVTIRISPKTTRKDFIDKLAKLSGQNIQQCFQCGTCSGACPMLESMDTHPRKIVHMAQLGLREELERANTCWVCASCHTCNVMCPRGVDLPRVMEALRQMTLRKNQNMIEPSQISDKTLREYPQIAMVAGFRKLTG